MIYSNQGKALINSCDSVLIMKQSAGSVDEVIKFFKLAESTKDILLNARPGDAILCQSGRAKAVRVDMTEYESKFITT